MTMSTGGLSAEVLARRDALPGKPAPVVLTGATVVLAPLVVARDVEALFAISDGSPCARGERAVAAYDPDALVWRWMFGGPYPDAASLGRDLARMVEAPDGLPMVVRERASGEVLGVAMFMTNRPADLKIELGGIWYGPIAQGTGASREVTWLMCAHAFALGYRRVEWKCDARNLRSRRAARSYGFTFEGVQARHMIVKGGSRDTAWFRLLDDEWPRVQAMAAVAVAPVTAPTDEVRELVAALEAELAVGYLPAQRHGLAVDALFQPHIRFFVARLDGVAVGCGGVALDGDQAEVKRMYVRPAARGRGVAPALLARLEAVARAAGVGWLRLETGDVQHAAMRFYEGAGFRRCGRFGAYATMDAHAIATSVFFEKALA